MKPPAYITTSWDDGHPLDLRMADLLHKYDLPATFYIPLGNKLPVLTHSQVRELSARFEVGAHTVSHCDLLTVPDDVSRGEIFDCKSKLEQICGHPCTAFCFPKGHFHWNHLRNVRDAGYRVARTVELMSLEMPRIQAGIAMMPTTLQAGSWGLSRVARNSIKRLRPTNLFRYLRFRKSNWVATAEAVLEHVLSCGGVFHFWGHSWEVDEIGEWQNVERVFALLSQCKGRVVFTDNTGLSETVSPLMERRNFVRPTKGDSKPAVMLVHNFYQHRGGEDNVVDAELRLLKGAGHRTVSFFRHNREIGHDSWWAKSRLGMRTVWSLSSARELRGALQSEKPDLVHFHNFLPLLSPALYYVCKDLNIPVVQTLHNYRLLCPSATLYRDGKVCEECLGRVMPWPAIVHKCYRQDRLASAAVGAMITTHGLMGTWRNHVDCYIALSEFARRKFAENGIPGHKIVVKPNCVDPDPGAKQGPGEYALFVGRLSPEKGIRTLLDGWRRLKMRVPLAIVGEGPCAPDVIAARAEVSSIQWLGQMTKDKVTETMKCARFLVLPSECYENLPLALVEAFSCALPVVASALGAVSELVDDGRTGLTFRGSDPWDLVSKVEWAWSHPWEMEQMGREARREYGAKYTATANYQALLAIYEQVLHCGSLKPSNLREIVPVQNHRFGIQDS